jgi:predicted amidohydrolase
MGIKRQTWNVAAVQMTSTADVEKNVARALQLLRRATERGAELVSFPENLAYLRKEGAPVEFREAVDGDLVDRFRDEARRLGVYVLLGSIPEKIPRSRKIFNTSVLIGPWGRVLATYRKMHLFDIDVRGKIVLRESKTVRAGEAPVVANTPLGRLGLSICYDLRFPELYRHLALQGAQVLFVPAAFTAYTGPHHWLPLLRARAIENQCWVVAPAQYGRHDADRSSHGESVIIDPWGTVVQRLRKGEGIITGKIDLTSLRRIRSGLPCLSHTRTELLRPFDSIA